MIQGWERRVADVLFDPFSTRCIVVLDCRHELVVPRGEHAVGQRVSCVPCVLVTRDWRPTVRG